MRSDCLPPRHRWCRACAATKLKPRRQPAKEPAAEAKPAAEESPDIVYLSKDHSVWLNKKTKQVLMTGKISIREGNLEMLASPRAKDYESIVCVTASDMSLVHAGLLAVGAKPGHPSRYSETKFTPASGTRIDVTIRWTDKEGKKHDVPAQDLVRNLKTRKSLDSNWVFGGSLFRVNADTGEKQYLADDGDFICVSNFPDSMLDLPYESPKDWSEHVFEPFTERIPPKGTDVILVLTPKPEKAEPGKNKSGE